MPKWGIFNASLLLNEHGHPPKDFCNRPRLIYSHSNMALRLSGQNCNSCFALSCNKKIIWKPFSGLKVRKMWCYKRLVKTLLQVLSLCVFLNFRYSSKCFAQIYRAQYGAAMLVYLRGTPIWRPENSVNIWKLLCLSRQLIICTEKTSIYIKHFS